MLYGICIGIFLWSVLGTVTFLCTRENENVAIWFGMGVVGWVLMGAIKIIRHIKKAISRKGNRAVFENKKTGERNWANLKDTDDILWNGNYKLIQRYAPAEVWKQYKSFSQEFISASKDNCGNCKYERDCDRDYPYEKVKCKNVNGVVIEFDRFERK